MWLTKLRPILGYGLHSRQILLKNHGTFNTLSVFPVGKFNPHRTYKNFGHKRDPPEHPLKQFYIFAFISFIVYQFVNWEKVYEVVFPPVDADSNIDTTESPVQEILEETVDKKKKKT